MSLATRCPACHTVFRVVQDQLRVSEGWVRCGQCQEVFNALETLFDLGPLGVAEGTADVPAASAAEPVAESPVAGEPMSLDELAAAPVAQPATRPTEGPSQDPSQDLTQDDSAPAHADASPMAVDDGNAVASPVEV